MMKTPTAPVRVSRRQLRFALSKGRLVAFLNACSVRWGDDLSVTILIHRAKGTPERIAGRVYGMQDKDRHGVVAVIEADREGQPNLHLPPITLKSVFRYGWQLGQCEEFPALITIRFPDHRAKEHRVYLATRTDREITLHCRPTRDRSYAYSTELAEHDRTHFLLPAACLRWGLDGLHNGELFVRLPGEPGPDITFPGDREPALTTHPLFEMIAPWQEMKPGSLAVFLDAPPAEACRRLTPKTLAKLLPKSVRHGQPAICCVVGGGRSTTLAIGQSEDCVSSSDLPLALRLHKMPSLLEEIEAFLADLWSDRSVGFEARWSGRLVEWRQNPAFCTAIQRGILRVRYYLNRCDWAGEFCCNMFSKLGVLDRAGFETRYENDEFLFSLSTIAKEGAAACSAQVRAGSWVAG
jgi:hypothetical protein